MSGNLSKLLNFFLFALVGIAAILTAMFYAGGVTAESMGTLYEEPIYTDQFMLFAMVLFIFAAAMAVVFPLISLALNPKGAMKTLVVLAIAAVIIFVSFSMASDAILDIPGYTGTDNVPASLKFAGTSLNTMYVMFILTIGSVIFAEVARIFK